MSPKVGAGFIPALTPLTVIISFPTDRIFRYVFRGEGGDKPRPYHLGTFTVPYIQGTKTVEADDGVAVAVGFLALPLTLFVMVIGNW